jgi:PTH2 family peptidyl-tRNA hydrolase
LRSDIALSQGKAIAQAGHAYLDTVLSPNSLRNQDYQQAHIVYLGLRPGTKITLDGGSEDDMHRLLERLAMTSIPHSQIIDSDHIELPDFDGRPVFTAIGIGPIFRCQMTGFLRRLPLWPAASSNHERL